MNKTRRVEIERLVKHKRYGKYMRRRTVCHVHDENNESHKGDTVEIIEAAAAVEDQALGAGADRHQESTSRHRRDAGRGRSEGRNRSRPKKRQ